MSVEMIESSSYRIGDPPLILKALEYLPGGVTLDVSEWSEEVIPAGTPVALMQDRGVYKPVKAGGFVPLGGALIGIVVNSVTREKPVVSVLTSGQVNAKLMDSYPSFDIVQSLPRIDFLPNYYGKQRTWTQNPFAAFAPLDERSEEESRDIAIWLLGDRTGGTVEGKTYEERLQEMMENLPVTYKHLRRVPDEFFDVGKEHIISVISEIKPDAKEVEINGVIESAKRKWMYIPAAPSVESVAEMHSKEPTMDQLKDCLTVTEEGGILENPFFLAALICMPRKLSISFREVNKFMREKQGLEHDFLVREDYRLASQILGEVVYNMTWNRLWGPTDRREVQNVANAFAGSFTSLMWGIIGYTYTFSLDYGQAISHPQWLLSELWGNGLIESLYNTPWQRDLWRP